jgi:ankyrin repeat protein
MLPLSLHQKTENKFMEDMTDAEAVNSEDEGDMTLHEASENGDEKKVDQFLKKGADVNAEDEYGYTPLSCAASRGHEKVAELLLRNKADINAWNHYGTALHVAAENGHANVASLLLKEGTDINTKDEDGKTALDEAVDKRHLVRVLLRQESWLTKGYDYERVVRLLYEARDNVEGRRG